MKTKIKSISGAIAGILILAAVASSLFVTSCSKDDSVNPVGGTNNTGSDQIITVAPGNTWVLDKTHSNIMWETFYFGSNALLTGRFNSFGVSINFKQDDLANSTLSSWVVLSTFNTGEPGRDAYGKCGPTYMGVLWDTISAGPPVVLAPKASTDTAWYSSTGIVKYGTGYKAAGNLTFRGVTKPVDLFFTYAGITEYPTTPVSYKTGFIGEFTIKAISDFGVTSTSISDDVKIRIDANCKKL